jgi:mono/diheme cytochrome c family protein
VSGHADIRAKARDSFQTPLAHEAGEKQGLRANVGEDRSGKASLTTSPLTLALPRMERGPETRLAVQEVKFRRAVRAVQAALIALVLASCAACQQQMGEQPSYRPLKPSEFFADGQSARPLIPGTVARGQLRLDRAYYTGLQGPTPGGGEYGGPGGLSLPVARTALPQQPYVDTFPFPVTRQVLQRGKERFTIYCSVCHGPLGYGDGVVVERGFTKPNSYHSDRLRSAPVGYFFDVITHGYGSMPDYASQVPPEDRWAIVAYVRALQLSQHATLVELPEAIRKTAESELKSAER